LYIIFTIFGYMRVYQHINNQELINLLHQDDRRAFTEIYYRYENLLQRHAYKKLGDLDETNDILQELFVSLWDKRTELPVTANLSGYLYSIMRNKILNRFAHKQVENKYTASLQQFLNKADYCTELTIRENEMADIIQKEIDQLPARMREIFLLSRRDNLSHNEIALKLSLTGPTVSRQISNALKVLRLKLGSMFCLIFF
jgi:RNA polymerase sigma-70 factor (ECF subfamily)